MNMINRTPVTVSSSKRNMFRRLLSTTTAACVLTLASASALAADGHGKYTVTSIAGVGDSYTGKLDVKGNGKFKAVDDGANIVLTSKIGKGDPELTMHDKRQDHTTGKDNKLGLKGDTVATITIAKAGLTFPEAGKKTSGKVDGKLEYLGKSQKVSIDYSVREEGGKFIVEKASFKFDYTKHRADGSKVCLVVVCVRPTVEIVVTGATIEAKK